MHVHFSNWFPFGKFSAINLFGHVFIKAERWKNLTERGRKKLLIHEAIHSAQMKELLYIGFYVIYGIEWLYWVIFRTKEAYHHINFEKEAFSHQGEDNYIENRKHFAQWRRNR